MSIYGLFTLFASCGAVAWLIVQARQWWINQQLKAQLLGIAWMRIPPVFLSEFPGDRTVQERAQAFAALLTLSGNKWFKPADIQIYTYQGNNGRPDDANPYGLTFEAWRAQAWRAYAEFEADWMAGAGRKGAQMSEQAKAFFLNQRQTGWENVSYQ